MDGWKKWRFGRCCCSFLRGDFQVNHAKFRGSTIKSSFKIKTLRRTNISHTKDVGKVNFLSHWWDMLNSPEGILLDFSNCPLLGLPCFSWKCFHEPIVPRFNPVVEYRGKYNADYPSNVFHCLLSIRPTSKHILSSAAWSAKLSSQGSNCHLDLFRVTAYHHPVVD